MSETVNQPAETAAERPKDERVKVRLLIDRLPKDPISFTDGRSFTPLWGLELDENNKSKGTRRQVKLWNRAGTTLLSIMKSRNLGTKNPMTIDLTGYLKPDRKDQTKMVLDAQVFQIVGEPERLNNRTTDPAQREYKSGESRPGDAKTADVKATGKPKTPRDGERKPAELDAVVTGIVDPDTRANGTPVMDLSALRMKEWSDGTIDRNSEAAMFRIRLAGPIARAAEDIQNAAQYFGYEMDIDNPVVVKLVGRWQKVENPVGEAAKYRPWIFNADTIEITQAPNLQQIEGSSFLKKPEHPQPTDKTARIAGPSL